MSIRIRLLSGAVKMFGADTATSVIRRRLDDDLPDFYTTRLYLDEMEILNHHDLKKFLIEPALEVTAVSTVSVDYCFHYINCILSSVHFPSWSVMFVLDKLMRPLTLIVGKENSLQRSHYICLRPILCSVDDTMPRLVLLFLLLIQTPVKEDRDPDVFAVWNFLCSTIGKFGGAFEVEVIHHIVDYSMQIDDSRLKSSLVDSLAGAGLTIQRRIDNPADRCSSCQKRKGNLACCWECAQWDCRSCRFWCTTCPVGLDTKYTICGHCNAEGIYLRQFNRIWTCRQCSSAALS